MRKKKPVLFILLFSAFVLFIILVMQPWEIIYGGHRIAFLFAKGNIAIKQRNLLFIIQAIMLLVVIPVYILTFIFSWHFRDDNIKAKYDPDWDDHPLAEFTWWSLPCFIIIIIGVLTWLDTFHLDPYKPIPSEKKMLKVQVVALQWKWLFIYPEEKVASLNFLQIPEQTPVHFEITADAPMNSFWIPQLAGQIYAMPKMKTQLHVIADTTGDFRGCSANISGVGFADMYFITRASHEDDFNKWIDSAKKTEQELSWEKYEQLAKPSQKNPPTLYRLKEENLFNKIINKYMHPQEAR